MTERLEVISGSMFAGKTRELKRLVERQEFADVKVQVFKPSVDDRWGKVNKTRTHSGEELDATPVANSEDLLSRVEKDTELVAIDEAQFFDPGIVGVVENLLDRNIKVLIAGLPLDFKGEPFGSMPILLAKADNTIKVTAICTAILDTGKKCGQEATRTQRFVNGVPAKYDDDVVVIGAEEKYAPRCPNHHVVLNKPDRKTNGS